MALAPGSRLGPYEVVGSPGAGGMGEVYRARDTKLGREVAIKVLPDAFTTFVPGATTLLFDTAGYLVEVANRRSAVSGDGRRFLLLKNATTAATGGTAPRLLFVENWFEELKQRVPIP